MKKIFITAITAGLATMMIFSGCGASDSASKTDNSPTEVIEKATEKKVDNNGDYKKVKYETEEGEISIARPALSIP